MSFREKSAWLMAFVTGAAGLFYLAMVLRQSAEGAAILGPMPIIIAYVVLLVAGSVIAQATLGGSAPKEANAPPDERERPLLDRAGNWSGVVLAVGAVTSLLHFLARGDGNLLFHMVMGSLILAQMAEYGFQILLLRRS